MTWFHNVKKLKDNELLTNLDNLVKKERNITAQILIHLVEVEERKLYAISGFSSMFQYVTEKLGYSESSSLKRIQVARAGRKFPIIFELLENRKISLTATMKLCPHLKKSNHKELLEKSQGKSVREVEKWLSGIFPKPTPEDSIKDISEDQVWFSFCGDESLKKMVDDARDFFRHKYPKGRLNDIFSEAMNLLIEKKKKERTSTTMPQKNNKTKDKSRHIPKSVKAVVWNRDEGRCSYVSQDGKRCTETGCLQWDHKIPWALGGKSNDPENIRLLCRTHNLLMADNIFGREYIENKIKEKVSEKQSAYCMNRFMLTVWMNGGIRPIKEAVPLQ